MINKKKAISPVVATALLLVVAVVAVVGFQTWFNTFQSGQLADVEDKSNQGSALTVERLDFDSGIATVYIKSTSSINITATSVDISSATCTANTSQVIRLKNITKVNVACASDIADGNQEDIVIRTPEGVYSSTQIAR